ncbi:MAG: XRE family transcriptional regulator [Desulfarculus sp.]|nr:XRE family transcriptional regulator [Desulfarculus sp.]
MIAYPVILTLDSNGTFIAQFPDVPEALTVGSDQADALYWAQDALVVALSGYLDDRRDIPQPSKPKRGQKLVALPPLVALKLAIYQAMRDQGLSQAELATRLKCDSRQVRRLLDLDHNSRLDLLAEALKALGKRLVIEVADAA